MSEDYTGLLGAIPYAFRRSDSRLFRSYVLVGGLATLLVTALIALGLAVLVEATLAGSALVTLSRSFYVLIGLLIVAPLVAPILFVARRHRREQSVTPQYDRRLALAGYGFLAALYVGIAITIPPAEQTADPGPIVAVLYALPWYVGILLPTAAAVGIYHVHRRSR